MVRWIVEGSTHIGPRRRRRRAFWACIRYWESVGGGVQSLLLSLTLLAVRFLTAVMGAFSSSTLMSMFSRVMFSRVSPGLALMVPMLRKVPVMLESVTLRTMRVGGSWPWRSKYWVQGLMEMRVASPLPVMSRTVRFS